MSSITWRHEKEEYDGTRVDVKFCDKLHKSPSETLEMLETVYGKSTMSKGNGYIWHKISEKAEKVRMTVRCKVLQ
jgi:hypothetical protein